MAGETPKSGWEGLFQGPSALEERPEPGAGAPVRALKERTHTAIGNQEQPAREIGLWVFNAQEAWRGIEKIDDQQLNGHRSLKSGLKALTYGVYAERFDQG